MSVDTAISRKVEAAPERRRCRQARRRTHPQSPAATSRVRAHRCRGCRAAHKRWSESISRGRTMTASRFKQSSTSTSDSDLVEPRLQPPVRVEEQLILTQVSLMPFRVRVHGGHLVGKSLRHVKAVEDANSDPADDGRAYLRRVRTPVLVKTFLRCDCIVCRDHQAVSDF
jgi:hypothetical protein